MSVDMTKWCEIAKANMGKRPAGEGRLGGKICIVTGAARGLRQGHCGGAVQRKARPSLSLI